LKACCPFSITLFESTFINITWNDSQNMLVLYTQCYKHSVVYNITWCIVRNLIHNHHQCINYLTEWIIVDNKTPLPCTSPHARCQNNGCRNSDCRNNVCIPLDINTEIARQMKPGWRKRHQFTMWRWFVDALSLTFRTPEDLKLVEMQFLWSYPLANDADALLIPVTIRHWQEPCTESHYTSWDEGANVIFKQYIGL